MCHSKLNIHGSRLHAHVLNIFYASIFLPQHNQISDPATLNMSGKKDDPSAVESQSSSQPLVDAVARQCRPRSIYLLDLTGML
jgi:hypothetical protein